MSPHEQERFLETLLEHVHEALRSGHRVELHVSFEPPHLPHIVVSPTLTSHASSYYTQLYGMTLKEMAQRYHRSVTTIWRWVHADWRPK